MIPFLFNPSNLVTRPSGSTTAEIPVFAILQVFHLVFREEYEFETGRLVTGFIVWTVTGFFGFGLLMWWLNERAYKKLTTKNPDK